MIPTMAQFQAKAQQILRAQVEWARTEYQIPKLNPQLVFWDKTTGPEGQASGRTNKMRIKSFYFTRFPTTGFTEYASYAWRPEVGGFKTDDWTLSLEALIAHELAHFIHFAFKLAQQTHPLREGSVVRGLGQFDTEAHGYFFQRILLFMRRKFVNDRIENGAHTAHASSFNTEGFFEERMAAMPACPYAGMEFNIGRHRLRMAGYNPNTTKKLYKYQAESRDKPGTFYAVKLKDFINNSTEGKALMERTPALQKEYQEHIGAQASKRLASARSSATKRRRNAFKTRMAA